MLGADKQSRYLQKEVVAASIMGIGIKNGEERDCVVGSGSSLERVLESEKVKIIPSVLNHHSRFSPHLSRSS